MKILLTGASGLLGREIGRVLAAAGHEVRGTARHPSVGVAAVDCRDAEMLARSLRGTDMLVHNAGIGLGAHVAEAVRMSDIARVVAISSAAVTSRSRASALSYRVGEEALVSAHRRVLLVRPTMIYGSSRDRNVHHAISFARRFGFLPLVGDGSAKIQPIHFRDLAAAVGDLAEGDAGGIVHAGGAQAVALRDAAAAILDALEMPRRMLRVPYSLARMAGTLGDRVTGRRILERVDRMLEDRIVDNARLLQLTSVRPRDFQTGVRDQVREIAR